MQVRDVAARGEQGLLRNRNIGGKSAHCEIASRPDRTCPTSGWPTQTTLTTPISRRRNPARMRQVPKPKCARTAHDISQPFDFKKHPAQFINTEVGETAPDGAGA
jgi:hypothetical protein